MIMVSRLFRVLECFVMRGMFHFKIKAVKDLNKVNV